MRVIINLHSKTVIDNAGWRALEVVINNEGTCTLKEMLDTVIIGNNNRLSKILLNNNNLNNKYILFVNGIQIPDEPDLDLVIKDSTQIHIMDRHFER